ncbi:MAG: cytochrome c oxidase subunit II [Pseudomonadota bacterium]
MAQETALTDYQMWHQPANSEIMRRIESFNAGTMWLIGIITLFVLALLIYVCVRFSAKNNPVPSKTSHNSLIEVIWTLGPVVILVGLAIPSFQLLTAQYSPPEEPALTVKATGYQWYWGYEYQDGSEISFDSVLIGRDDGTEASKAEAKAEREEYGKTDLAKYPRLLAVDNELVVPVGKVIRVLVTGADVIHNFAMPAFGLKTDAVPGRINEAWFLAEREGLFYGQCSELCGKDHAFMPLGIRVVSQEQFDAWKTAAVDDLDVANKALMASVEERNKKLRLAAAQK